MTQEPPTDIALVLQVASEQYREHRRALRESRDHQQIAIGMAVYLHGLHPETYQDHRKRKSQDAYLERMYQTGVCARAEIETRLQSHQEEATMVNRVVTEVDRRVKDDLVELLLKS